MSNIREIDGVFVNLDLVRYIEINDYCQICFIFQYNQQKVEFGEKKDVIIKDILTLTKQYETENKARNRIREIIKMQEKK